MITQKKCKGTGKAKGYGCDKFATVRTYGLGHECKCYQKWLLNSEEGKEKMERSRLKSRAKVINKKKAEDRAKRIDLNSSTQMKLADMYFSRYIRLLHSDEGKCTCYTCGAILDIKECDCGHYMKREHQATRYNENNNKPQCKKCNGDTKHNGKQLEFRENLINEIGLDEVLEIERLSKTSIKTSGRYFKEIADEYRIKVNELQKKMGVKVF